MFSLNKDGTIRVQFDFYMMSAVVIIVCFGLLIVSGVIVWNHRRHPITTFVIEIERAELDSRFQKEMREDVYRKHDLIGLYERAEISLTNDIIDAVISKNIKARSVTVK